MSQLRDEAEAVIDAWNAYEIARGQEPIIDYDCRAGHPSPPPSSSRFEVLDQVEQLRQRADAHPTVLARLAADEAYLRALLGERRPLADYLRETQGVSSAGWSLDYLHEQGELVRELLADQGITWGPRTANDLRELEGPIGADAIPDAIRQAASDLEPVVRE